MSEDITDSIPMRETVKRGLIALHNNFNREHADFLLLAAQEAGLDPNEWKPDTFKFTFEKVKPDALAPS